jgi:O-antigen ligase
MTLFGHQLITSLGLRIPSLPALEAGAAFLCLAGLVVWVALRQPIVLLGAFVFLQLTRLDYLLPETGPISVSLGLEMLLAGGILLHWITSGSPLRVAWPQTILFNAYVLLACLSSFFIAPDTVDLNGRLVIKDLLVRWFTVMAVTQLAATQEDQEKMFKLVLVSTLVLIGLSLGKMAVTGTGWRFRELPPWVAAPDLNRANAPGVHTDNLATELVMVFPILFSYSTTPGISAWKTLSLVMTPLLFLNVVLTYSRTGFLASGLVILGVLFYRRGWGKALAVVAVVLAVLLLAPHQYWERMATITTDREGENRVFLYAAAVKMIQASPILGVGYGGYQHLVNRFYPLRVTTESGSPHNIYLELWAETGIVALLLFLLLLGTSLLDLHRARRELASLSIADSRLFALQLSLLMFMLCGITTPILLDPVFYVILGMVLAMKASHWPYIVVAQGQGPVVHEGAAPSVPFAASPPS